MATMTAMVTVQLDIQLDGEPVSRMLDMPAVYEITGHTGAMVIHLHLDARKIAKALYPHLAQEAHTSTAQETN